MAVTKDKTLKENPWYFTIEVNENGKRKRIKRRGFKTKKAATEAQQELLAELNKGFDFDGSRVIYRDFMKDWLNDKKTKVKGSTLDTYSWLVNTHILPVLGDIKLGEITPRHIQNFYTKLFKSGQLADENIQKCHTIINESLKKAAGWDMIIKNSAALVDCPRSRKKEMLYWTEEESHRFLKVAKEDRYYHAFLLALTTGMRQGEILGVRVKKDLNLDQRMISVSQILSHDGKTIQVGAKSDAGNRTIGLDKTTTEELRRLLQRNKKKLMPVQCTRIMTY
ncbi:site-specific integrase [Paenibacillus sp. Marseille-Q4541]|uniref:site-specific integrase n=1 Tax=Paenibacillus sp. Marseille-Q4541 TaxID=2831522 RepID=UPI001BA847EA|nr:site-specific integrase [Paenibacillus sp. Marseille-Q4541]